MSDRNDGRRKPKRKASRSPTGKTTKRPWRRRIKRVAMGVLIALPLLLLGLWLAAHRYPWVGASLADGLRSLIGAEAVSRLQDFAYDIDDRWKRFWRAGDPPKAHWDVPEPATTDAADTAADSVAAATDGGVDGAEAPQKRFTPKAVGPMFETLAAKGDGVWVAVPDPLRPTAPALVYKTLIHPDRKRPWAELFVITVDLRQVELHVVPGRYEPRSHLPEARDVERPAVIPSAHHSALLAAFNGGFKAVHGRWGMRAGGVTFIKPRKHGCTVARYQDGSLRIDPWHDVESREVDMQWWRQTPPCMYRQGKRHGGLWDPDAKGWGAALEGGTVIRRSAIGLNVSRDVLYVSVSNDTTARAIADGMFHVGAVDVAQLDVNYSYPKIVMFPQGESGLREPKSLFKGFETDENEYIRSPSPRDFFFLTRSETP